MRPPTSTFADSEVQYPRTGRFGDQDSQPFAPESEGGSTVETAKSQAANVKDAAAGAASSVKEVARSEVSYVASEAKYQARNLFDQTSSELRGQARNQQWQLASKLNSWASELGSMASKSDDSGPMTELAREASRRVGGLSHWLDTHEPADLLHEVKRFARRRPGTFLALAAAAGVVAGRLTRGAVAPDTSVDADLDVTPARAYESGHDPGNYDRGGYDGGLPGGGDAYGTRGYQDAGYDPRYSEVRGETSYQGGGMPAPGMPTDPTGQHEYSAGPAHPNVTPTTDEPYHASTEGDVRR